MVIISITLELALFYCLFILKRDIIKAYFHKNMLKTY